MTLTESFGEYIRAAFPGGCPEALERVLWTLWVSASVSAAAIAHTQGLRVLCDEVNTVTCRLLDEPGACTKLVVVSPGAARMVH